mgnify:FL=1|jgi:hypothetical protein|tara:strand:- start:2449 stop:2991 length:543 start_codon:yes stop_codon:yes gene_type:complete
MKNKKSINLKNHTDYSNDMYDEMKTLLNKSKLMMEQVEVEDIKLEREAEKTKTYDVSSGKIVVHGYTTSDVALTDEEKNTYQETMDEFLEQVSDLVDYNTLNIYTNNVEWSGKLVKFDTEFFYSVGERNGVYIIGNMIKIDDEAMEMLNNLKDYYQTFSVKWAKILADRKSTKTMEDENE